MRDLNAGLASTNSSMEEFVSLVSHELLAPLATIQENLGYLQKSRSDDAELAELLGETRAAALRLVGTVNGLALVARSGHASANQLRTDASRSDRAENLETVAPIGEHDRNHRRGIWSRRHRAGAR
jgi:signal transduction histidine kinase